MLHDIIHQSNWTQSALGQNIELYRKKHNDPKKPLIIFIGGVHGDEPEGVQLAQDFLKWLHSQDQQALNNWILIPCLNIDGHTKNERTNGNHVDLNRNFPTRDWSSEAKAPRYFPGNKPHSEPEVQALCQLLLQEKPQLIIHFHSWEPSLVYTGTPGAKAAKILSMGNNYPVKEDIGYPTPGSLGQYGWLELKTPVVCIEEQEHCDLSTVWMHFSEGLQQLMVGDIV